MKTRDELSVVNIRLVREPSIYSEEIIHSPNDALKVMGKEIATFDREVLAVLNLSQSGKVINMSIASVGTIMNSFACPREIFKSSILSNAANIILMHNHPSGNLEPSKEDYQVTKRMVQVGALLDIPVLDHVIVGPGHEETFSFRTEGLIRKYEVEPLYLQPKTAEKER